MAKRHLGGEARPAERAGRSPRRRGHGAARAAFFSSWLPLALVGGACGDAPPPEAAADTAPPPQVVREARPGEENAPPEIRGLFFEPARLRAGGQVAVRADVSDPEGDATWIDYRWTVDGQPRAERSPRLSLRGVPKGAQIAVRVVARDGFGESVPRELSDWVANTPPEVTALRLNAESEIVPGDPLLAQVEGRDADGDAVAFQYRWLVDGVPEQTGTAEERFDTAQLQRGARVRVEVVPDDGEVSGQPWHSEEITVANRPPEILSLPEQASQGGEDFRYNVEARDPDGDKNLRYELVEAPVGMTLDPVSGELRWRPGLDQAGDHPVKLVVSDFHGGAVEQQFVIPVAIEDRLQPDDPASPDATGAEAAGANSDS